jgi:hypothetical protein
MLGPNLVWTRSQNDEQLDATIVVDAATNNYLVVGNQGADLLIPLTRGNDEIGLSLIQLRAIGPAYYHLWTSGREEHFPATTVRLNSLAGRIWTQTVTGWCSLRR